MADTAAATIIGPHGAKVLPSVEVDSYNLELKDDEGFLGDRASRRAFHAILENWRKPLRKLGTDPFGETDSDALSRSKLDEIMKAGKDIEAIAVIQSAIEEYAQELALVVRRFLKAKAWEGTECIVIGNEGRLTDVLWEGPAFQKGLTAGTQIVAVGGTTYRANALKDAIRDAAHTRTPIELLVKNGDHYRTVSFDYYEGLQYPHLEKNAAGAASLDEILTPRK